MDTSIQAVCFDVGRVLVHFDHEGLCKALAEHSTALTPEEVSHLMRDKGELRVHFSTGKITPRVFFKETKKLLSLSEDLSFETFVKMWENIFTPNAPLAYSLLGQIRADVDKFIISDIDELRWKKIFGYHFMKTHFAPYFCQILSFRMGVMKPDQQMYIEAIRRAGVHPQHILYFDDLPENIAVFKKMGGNAILYDCRKHSEKYLKDVFSSYGLMA